MKAARRYANAFLQTAIEQDQLEAVLDDVQSIYQTVEASRELRLFLKSPVISSEEKGKALLSVFGQKMQPLTIRFLELVIGKGREDLIEKMMWSFIVGYKRYSGIIDVSVSTATDIPDDHHRELMAALHEITRKKVNLTHAVKEDLIGGMAVQIEDTVIDGTIKQKINRLQKLFKEAAI